jgi:hypothetical protein
MLIKFSCSPALDISYLFSLEDLMHERLSLGGGTPANGMDGTMAGLGVPGTGPGSTDGGSTVPVVWMI